MNNERQFAGGNGTANDPYKIATAEQLEKFAELVNDYTSPDTDACAVLTADINLSGVGNWTPIGDSSNNQYSGSFDGDGHTISGLNIAGSDDYQGLFGYVYQGGTVQNLTVDGTVSGAGTVGGIVAQNYGTIQNCTNTGTVTGTYDYVGGVVGYNSGSVENCYNTGTVSGGVVGGVVGYNSSSSTVENCYNTGAVNSSGSNVGGVVGYNNGGTVTNCYNTGSVSGSGSSSFVGGVVGGNDEGTVENCYNIGEVSGSGTSSYVGGVVGWNDGTVTNCYNTGIVTGPDSGTSNKGGVVGLNSGTVTGCYFLNGTAEDGIGSGEDAEGAAAVTNLDELCEALANDGTWSTSPFYAHPVLKANPEGGDGTAAHPYEIKTVDQLEDFRDLVNGEDGNPNAHAVLMNNIDLNNEQWEPIGNEDHPYTGTFNGNGHKIENLYINNTGIDDQGLFGRVGTSGYNKGIVQNLTVTGSVSGYWYVGGVVGCNNGGTVENCHNTGTVTGTYDFVGGVVGYNSGTNASVKNCYNTGAVNSSGDTGGNNSGGVVGYNSGTVENCYNTGNISGKTSGGVVGWNDGNVTNCYNIGDVSGSGNCVGGVVGDNYSSVTNCYFLQTDDVNKNLQGIGVGSGDANEKDNAAFHSGEVAYLLQKEQKAPAEGEEPPLVWGQTLTEGDEKDDYPQLVVFDADALQVYKASFNPNYSGAASIDDQYTNGKVTLPAAPTRDGYTFNGWSDGATTHNSGTTVTVTADTKFTAEWTVNTYTITVTAGSGGTVSGGGSVTHGDSVEVTATANPGYHFVNWTENGSIVSTETTFTFTATANRTLTANFAADAVDPDPTPTPTPDPEPSGPSTGDSTGWDDILDELENTAKGDEITIDMGDETKVPAEIFETLAGQDITLEIALEGGVTWTVNGQDIPADANLTDLDLGVDLGTSGIPVNVINTITGEIGTVQITLAHDGEFGFTMTLTAPLGKENAGYWANLYHYKVNGGEADREDPLGDDEDAEALNFEAAAEIDADGSVSLPMSHASQYAIVIDTHSHATVDVSDLFIDIAPDAWYKDAVQYAYDNGLMTGVSDTEFAPEATTTRAMIVSILARLEGVTTAEAAGFADVDDNDWYATAVNWAANVGVVNGYEDNTFRPNTAITREQLAAILMNYAAYKGEDVSNRADLANYTDQPSTWAEEAMQWAVAEGLISGVTNTELQPQGNATRAQVAAILQRFLSE